MGLSQNPLFSDADIQQMREAVQDIDAALLEIERLEKVNRNSGTPLFSIDNEKKQLAEQKQQLQALLQEYG